jgi:DNA-binding transcriptional ArsR family regulator
MVIKSLSSPFGSTTRTRVLVALRLLGSSFPRELARLLAVSPSLVLKALRSLERDGLVAGRTIGRSRVYTLDPRYFAKEDLQRYLVRLSQGDVELRQRVAQLRRRPRWTGKPL